jgi:hypothetical protein
LALQLEPTRFVGTGVVLAHEAIDEDCADNDQQVVSHRGCHHQAQKALIDWIVCGLKNDFTLHIFLIVV